MQTQIKEALAALSSLERQVLRLVADREAKGDPVATSTPISTLINLEAAGLIVQSKAGRYRPVYVLASACREARS